VRERRHVTIGSQRGQLLAAAAMMAVTTVAGGGRSADMVGTATPLSAPASAAPREATSTAVPLVTTPAQSAPPTQPATNDPVTMVASAPVRLQVPAIGVDTELIELGLRADGSLEVPPSGFPAGWYSGAPTPGELGPAIIAGHVDWAGQPGVFYDLRDLAPGDDIAVTRQDGSTAQFRVMHVEQFDKDAFPTHAVYGNLDHAGLRLITCAGAFDQGMRSYDDNLVVFAELVGIASD